MRSNLTPLLVALALTACATGPVKSLTHSNPVSAPPPTMQFLYGSGEAAALSRQAYAAFTEFALAQASGPADERRSVVLAADATLAQPAFTSCEGKPTAVMLDTDETAILNLGFEFDQARTGRAFDPKRWSKWEQSGDAAMVAVPGARESLAVLRARGITVIFNSNRNSANAVHTERQLDKLGLGPAKHGETLFLAGDDPTGSNKDQRRKVVADRYCVVAMAGDQLGDFSDHFNAISNASERRTSTEEGTIAAMWGKGWFMIPNSVYGPALKGGFDEVFPVGRRWP